MRKLFLLLVSFILSAPAYAQVGIYIRPGTSSITSPVQGNSYVFNSLNNTIVGWNGTAWFVISAPQNNFAASTAPTSADDNTVGYSPGSEWYNTTNGFVYTCVSAATSAAVWIQINNLGSLSIPLTSLLPGGAASGQSLIFNGTHWAPGAPLVPLGNLLQTGALTGQVPVWNGSNWVPLTFPGGGGVSYVGLAMPSDLFSVSGSPITGSGTFTVTEVNQAAFTVYAGQNHSNFSSPGSFRQLSQRDTQQTVPQQVVSPNGILPVLPMGFSYTPGGITEYSVASNPSAICCGPDGNIWISLPSSNAIAKMDLTGSTLATYTIPSSGTAQAICYGPDGNLYFTDPVNSAIGQITTTGTITEYTITRTTADMPGICVGDDGRIFATAHDTSGYWYGMTTSGTITEYGPGDGSIAPNKICQGPDYQLWLTDDVNNAIVSSNYAGAFQVWSTFTSAPDAICAGPNNDIWFTIPADDTIGRINSATFHAGNFTFYTTGITSGASPSGICATPDGGCYFTENGLSQFGHINAFGVVTETPLTTPSSAPDSTCVGVDGAVYCAETAAAKIGIQALTTVHR